MTRPTTKVEHLHSTSCTLPSYGFFGIVFIFIFATRLSLDMFRLFLFLLYCLSHPHPAPTQRYYHRWRRHTHREEAGLLFSFSWGSLYECTSIRFDYFVRQTLRPTLNRLPIWHTRYFVFCLSRVYFFFSYFVPWFVYT